MAKNRNEQARRSPCEADKGLSPSNRGVYQSGIVDKALVERVRRFCEPEPWREGEAPPWSMVERYLATGEQREMMAEHARRSRAFADVLEALRNDEAEREDGSEFDGSGAIAVSAEPHDPPRSRGKLFSRLRLVR
jgi:hypothetical protein